MLVLGKSTRKSLLRGMHVIRHDLLRGVDLVSWRHLSFHSPAVGTAHEIQDRRRR